MRARVDDLIIEGMSGWSAQVRRFLRNEYFHMCACLIVSMIFEWDEVGRWEYEPRDRRGTCVDHVLLAHVATCMRGLAWDHWYDRQP